MIVWAEPDQAALIREVVAFADATLIAVGADEPQHTAELSEALDAERAGDLRQAIQHDDLDILWLAASQRLEPAERRLIRELGLRAVTSIPRPGAVTEAVAEPDDASTATFIPLMRHSAGGRATSDLLEAFGDVHSVSIAMRSGRESGTLFARLFDAMDFAVDLMGDVQSVDASLAGPLPGVPETLPNLRGHMTVNLRLAEWRCASISVSDQAGVWFRGASLIGDGGCVRIGDHDIEWTDHTGTMIDSQEIEGNPGAAGLIAEQISRVHNRQNTTDPPPDTTRILALCEAARLSALTGQGESPQRLLEMLSRL